MGAIHFIKREGLQIPPERKVLKASEYLTYTEAEKVVEEARKEAERIIREAGSAYEAEKEKGYRAGLEEGKITCSQQILDTVTSTVDYLGSLEEKVTNIVISALRKIIGEIDDRTLITKVIQSALTVVRNQKQVTLRVSPKQVETVKGALDGILGSFPAISFIDVMGDGRLKEGGCILESEIGVVDASIDVQLEAIRKSLTKRLKGPA